ncbi:MAG: cyclic nucleotide-binding domain-containing protein [Acidimicrobiia bacterium]|nr:cyclic nucleotide-binding domain-containing protein [Acidimicrobiia bacterium]
MTIEKHLESIELFGELTKKELKAVARLMTAVVVKPGRDLMVEGTSGREFLIIIAGEATVRRSGRIVARVGAGDFLGELAVIAGVPRTATVTADTEMEISVLNRREFSALLDEQPKLARKILVGAVKRLHALEPTMVK